VVVFLQTAIEVIYKFLLPKFKWRAQPTADYRPAERQIQQDAWCSARIARVSQQCLHRPRELSANAWIGTTAT